jgi:antitoxin (DNA-binding transcriptional repressor) of toxin-antitoxin stability system
VKTIKIRDLRGALLEKCCADDELVGVTNNRVLTAVLVPVGRSWVDHIVEMNWSRITQSVSEGTDERLSDRPLTTLDAGLGASESATSTAVDQTPAPSLGSSSHGVSPIDVVQRATQALAQLGRHDAADDPGNVADTPIRSVRIGDLSGIVLDDAAQKGELVAVTNDRILIAFLIPVTEALVTHLIETNMSRVMFNILRGEQERRSESPFVTLDQALVQPASAVQSPTDVALRARDSEDSHTAASASVGRRTHAD